MMTLRLVIADDNYLVREGVRRLLDDGDEVATVGTAASAPELIDARAGAAARRRADRHPHAAVLHDRRDHRRPASCAASTPPSAWWSCRSTPTPRTRPALFAEGTGGPRLPAQGPGGRPGRSSSGRCAPSTTAGRSSTRRWWTRCWRPAGGPTASPVRNLSARELDVLRGMAEGRTNGAIAAQLHVSESAVSKHVASIFAKLGLHESSEIDRRVSAVLRWVEHRAADGP